MHHSTYYSGVHRYTHRRKMTVRCEKDDAEMHKTGELLDSADGELREELKSEAIEVRKEKYGPDIVEEIEQEESL